MPAPEWSPDPGDLIQAFEARRADKRAGALFSWAARAVEGLYYLDDLDASFDETRATVGDHSPDVVDLAHARWAATSCATAIDLCAAGLGRAYCQHEGQKELALSDFDSSLADKNGSRRVRRSKLPGIALEWVNQVLGDHGYTTVRDARNWLTHSRIPRRFSVGGSPPERLKLMLTPEIGLRAFVALAKDVASRHVQEFFARLGAL